MAKANLLVPLLRSYMESDPATAARGLESMTEDEAAGVLAALPPVLVAKAFPFLQVSYAATLLMTAPPKTVGLIVQNLDPKRASTILMLLPEDARESLLPQIPEKLKWEIRDLLTYPEDSVGRIMTTRFFSFRKDTKVRDAINKIRSMAKQRKTPASYAYVLDEENRLVGVMNMHDLLLAGPSEVLESVMRTEVFSLHCFKSCEEAAEELRRRRYFAAPVVDNENRMLGIIKAEQLLQGVREDVAEDIQKMVGAGADERAFSPILFSLRKRLPWLHVNLGTAFLAAAVVALFEDTIAKITVLAVFLPVVAGQGGNAGAQSLAIVMRGLVMREIPRQRMAQLIYKESLLGIINGAVIGVVTAGVAILWQGNAMLGLVIGLGMLVNLFVAGLSGASIPLVMRALRLDPAQCSSIILTTVTDVVGFLAFLGFAVLFQSHLA